MRIARSATFLLGLTDPRDWADELAPYYTKEVSDMIARRQRLSYQTLLDLPSSPEDKADLERQIDEYIGNDTWFLNILSTPALGTPTSHGIMRPSIPSLSKRRTEKSGTLTTAQLTEAFKGCRKNSRP
ncbi:hypothetical protein IMZ48_36750 [Candidatus Bathyarchaeota archaeon]|nr:hypothetical protein [Candidatus Bathyarchaeota archaeon]